MNVPTARLLRIRASFAVAALIAAAACTDKTKSTASADSTLARDLALAGQQTAQPTFQDTAVAPAPTMAAPSQKREAPAPVRTRVADRPATRAPRPAAQAPAPKPTPAPAPVMQAPIPTVAGPAPLHGEIGSGTSLALTSGAKVCTSTNLPGDKIVATVNEAVTGTNGAVIPAGSTVVLEVASVNSGSSADSTAIVFRVKSVVVNDKMYPLTGDVSTTGQLQKTKVAGSDPNADKKKVIGGALVGALLGQLIGHNTRGTIIGAAAGAATGAVVSKADEKWEGCLPAGAPLRLTLTGAVVMT